MRDTRIPPVQLLILALITLVAFLLIVVTLDVAGVEWREPLRTLFD